MDQDLKVIEIYASIQGESSWAGWPCVFVRLAGCPLRCRWCDTVYGFGKGQSMSIEAILKQVESYGIPLVELTGGEPLAQQASWPLIEQLIANSYQLLIETSGSISLAGLSPQAHIIMDIKCPGSGMSSHNFLENLELLKPSDEIKFVIASRNDFEWAKDLICQQQLDTRFTVLLSPAWGLVAPKDLAAWMLATPRKWRLNLQQHKYIWSPKAKGV